MSTLLKVENLSVDFLTAKKTFRAVDDVSFTVGRNEILGLAGESGCGKSTIAYAVMRLHKPPAFISAGDITFDGRDVLSFDSETLRHWRWSETSMVFQSAMNALNPVMTIFAQFRDFYATHRHYTREESREKAGEMLDFVGIPRDRLDSYPHQLSGGMRQRAVLALALALSPKLVIMDEPTTALDVVVQQEILREIVRMRAALEFAIIFITHDLLLMSQFADRIAVMQHGKIVEIGPTNDIVSQPRHAYTRQLWAAMPVLDQAEA